MTSDAIDLIIEGREKDLGDGFKVRRILPFHKQRMVGPIIFFDHFGPAEFKPGDGMDVRPHPHIGLATVTYLFEGAIAHKDTVGSDIVIRPGAVNWMVAGNGIVHSERTPPEERDAGMTIHGIQTWVALPKDFETCAPSFTHHPQDSLPVFQLGGAHARLLAGEAWGHKSPVEFPWGIWYVAVDAPEDAGFDVPADAAQERAVYVAAGPVDIAGSIVPQGSMAVLRQGAPARIAMPSGSKILLAGGQAMDGPRKIDWNLVASDAALIEKAREDWRASARKNWTGTRFSLPDDEHEYIPLPEDQ